MAKMKDSESDKIFEELGLKPQLFINEVLNNVDDLLDEAFQHFLSEASKLLNTDGTDRSDDLKKGVTGIEKSIQESLDTRLSVWEKYCRTFCFTLPNGFSLPSEGEAPDDDPMDQDYFEDEQVEERLDSLRKKLAEAGKECADLNQELQELEKKSAMSTKYISSVNEALQLYEKSSTHDMFQEMFRVGSELRRKVGLLKRKHMEIECNKIAEAFDPNGDVPEYTFNSGLDKLRLDQLQEIITKMNSIVPP